MKNIHVKETIQKLFFKLYFVSFFLVSSNNFTKKEGYMNIYGHILCISIYIYKFIYIKNIIIIGM